jgi:hypothetical protein
MVRYVVKFIANGIFFKILDEEFIFFWAFLWLILCTFALRGSFISSYELILCNLRNFFYNVLTYSQLGLINLFKILNFISLNNMPLLFYLFILVKNIIWFSIFFYFFIDDYSIFLSNVKIENINL